VCHTRCRPHVSTSGDLPFFPVFFFSFFLLLIAYLFPALTRPPTVPTGGLCPTMHDAVAKVRAPKVGACRCHACATYHGRQRHEGTEPWCKLCKTQLSTRRCFCRQVGAFAVTSESFLLKPRPSRKRGMRGRGRRRVVVPRGLHARIYAYIHLRTGEIRDI